VIHLARLKTLRSVKSFDKFIPQEQAVVIVYNYLCPACEQYLGELKPRMEEFNDFPIGRIHMNLEWVIQKAEMTGDVTEENMFLFDRYRVGDLFPVTLFFKNGELIKRVDGVQSPEQLREHIESIFRLELAIYNTTE
jgi:thiol-disulfide isomerase/thioredoxin